MRFAQGQTFGFVDCARICAGSRTPLASLLSQIRCDSSEVGVARTLVRPPGPFRTFPTRFPSPAVDHIFVNHALSPTHLNVHRTPLARLASDLGRADALFN